MFQDYPSVLIAIVDILNIFTYLFQVIYIFLLNIPLLKKKCLIISCAYGEKRGRKYQCAHIILI